MEIIFVQDFAVIFVSQLRIEEKILDEYLRRQNYSLMLA
jgi:hypothetical protein